MITVNITGNFAEVIGVFCDKELVVSVIMLGQCNVWLLFCGSSSCWLKKLSYATYDIRVVKKNLENCFFCSV